MNQASAIPAVKSKTESNMDLYSVLKNTGTSELECSVCFKGIQKTFFQCSAPCDKVIHVACMEKMIERTNEAAWEAGRKAEHKCCYCRREINIDCYILQRFARHLATLKSRACYDVSNALDDILEQLAAGKIDNDLEYEIYEIPPAFHQKKPKQAKRTMAKNPAIKQVRMRVKQNIGGRRR